MTKRKYLAIRLDALALVVLLGMSIALVCLAIYAGLKAQPATASALSEQAGKVEVIDLGDHYGTVLAAYSLSDGSTVFVAAALDPFLYLDFAHVDNTGRTTITNAWTPHQFMPAPRFTLSACQRNINVIVEWEDENMKLGTSLFRYTLPVPGGSIAECKSSQVYIPLQ